MFEVGFWELVLLLALGLIVLGPEKLPRVASELGRYAGQARRMARVLTTQIRQEIEAEEQRIVSPPPTYNRPGMEDLVPGAAPDASRPAAADHTDQESPPPAPPAAP